MYVEMPSNILVIKLINDLMNVLDVSLSSLAFKCMMLVLFSDLNSLFVDMAAAIEYVLMGCFMLF